MSQTLKRFMTVMALAVGVMSAGVAQAQAVSRTFSHTFIIPATSTFGAKVCLKVGADPEQCTPTGTPEQQVATLTVELSAVASNPTFSTGPATTCGSGGGIAVSVGALSADAQALATLDFHDPSIPDQVVGPVSPSADTTSLLLTLCFPSI